MKNSVQIAIGQSNTKLTHLVEPLFLFLSGWVWNTFKGPKRFKLDLQNLNHVFDFYSQFFVYRLLKSQMTAKFFPRQLT